MSTSCCTCWSHLADLFPWRFQSQQSQGASVATPGPCCLLGWADTHWGAWIPGPLRTWFYLYSFICIAAKSLQSRLTLCNPINGSPPGSPVPGILQARTLEWAAISFSNVWKWKVKSLSRVPLFATPWTAAHQAPPSTGFSRQEYWSGVPLPSPFVVTYS